MDFQPSIAFAAQMDQTDPLKAFRNRFHIPKHHGKEVIYLCGNSLGLQPQSACDAIEEVLLSWQNRAVEGHFSGNNPWMGYHRLMNNHLAPIVGAKKHEVVVMNSLTVNLHLLMVSFYRPSPTRFKILMEASAFPSDQYAVESQVRFHGYAPEEAIVEVAPPAGSTFISDEQWAQIIEDHNDSLALVLVGGVNYYTGQAYPIKKITQAAHQVGAIAGFDLAHAAGNIPLQLHDWSVDFAVWCSYKYMNAGPGGPSGVFVHEKYAHDQNLPRFAGWWGYHEESRFEMKKGFRAMNGAEGWQLSNGSILAMAPYKASLEIFAEAGMDRLLAKSKLLTQYLFFLVQALNKETGKESIKILTPLGEGQHGCQLSLDFAENGKLIFDQLIEKGIIGDWREPRVIRFAPVPLYNRFQDIYQVYETLKELLLKK